MVYSLNSCFVCVFAVLCYIAVTAGMPEYFVEDHCSQTLALNYGSIEAVRLRVSKSDKYPDGMRCAMRIQAPEGKKLLVRFETFDVRGIADLMCQSGDFVQFYDGANERSMSLPGLPQRVCHPPDVKKYVTSGQHLVIFFSSDTDRISGHGFKLSITAFNEGPCTGEQFQCKTSGRCIQKSLQCDGDEGCIDGSDEAMPQCLSTAAIVGIGVGGGVLLVFVIVVIVICVVRYKRRRRARIIKRALDARRYPSSLWISSATTREWTGNGSTLTDNRKMHHNANGSRHGRLTAGQEQDLALDSSVPDPVWDGILCDPVWDGGNQENEENQQIRRDSVADSTRDNTDIEDSANRQGPHTETRVPSCFWDIQLSDLGIGPITEI